MDHCLIHGLMTLVTEPYTVVYIVDFDILVAIVTVVTVEVNIVTTFDGIWTYAVSGYYGDLHAIVSNKEMTAALHDLV